MPRGIYNRRKRRQRNVSPIIEDTSLHALQEENLFYFHLDGQIIGPFERINELEEAISERVTQDEASLPVFCKIGVCRVRRRAEFSPEVEERRPRIKQVA